MTVHTYEPNLELKPVHGITVDRSIHSPERLEQNATLLLTGLVEDHDLAQEAAALTRHEVDQAREDLLQLPLVHRSSSARFDDKPFEGTSLYDAPVPRSFLPRASRHNTHKLDEQMNLDEFVFMSWGGVVHGNNSLTFLMERTTPCL